MTPLSRLVFTVMLSISWSGFALAADEASPAVEEVATAYEREIAAVQLETAQHVSDVRLQAIQQLQVIQDSLCRDAKLDEALAVRDRIRRLSGDPSPLDEPPPLPPAAAEIVRGFEIRAAALERKAIEGIEDAGRRAAEPLRRLIDELCRDARLDEAVQGRALLARLGSVVADVRPDPGHLNAQPSQIGEVGYFEVVGSNSGSLYGTDVYTGDSSLATAAVHSGALRLGERGCIKVTILPGAPAYKATTRHGVTSSSYGSYSVSLKVERAYVIAPLW
jgi:hypothetical protein